MRQLGSCTRSLAPGTMYFSGNTFDDLLRRVIEKLLKSKLRAEPNKGPVSDLVGVLLRLTNPRARLSLSERRGVIFGCLGEFLWYLSKTNSLRFIEYYLPRYKHSSDDGRTVFGGYGPRLFGMRGIDQIASVITLLKKHSDSRRAVVQLFDAGDLEPYRKDIPCTCTMQFLIRRRRLYMFTSMRSNDVYKGLPHDVFAFTMLQEMMARTLNVELGAYTHAVGSMHLYDDNREHAQQYLREGWQEKSIMPSMPTGDPWASMRHLMRIERSLRNGGAPDASHLKLHPYWQDLVRLLQIYRHYKDDKPRAISPILKQMSSKAYDLFIEQKKRKADTRTSTRRPKQLLLIPVDRRVPEED